MFDSLFKMLNVGSQQHPFVGCETPLAGGNQVLVPIPRMRIRNRVVAVVDPVGNRTLVGEVYPVYKTRAGYLSLPVNL